jgi:hypothetical protein
MAYCQKTDSRYQNDVACVRKLLIFQKCGGSIRGCHRDAFILYAAFHIINIGNELICAEIIPVSDFGADRRNVDITPVGKFYQPVKF